MTLGDMLTLSDDPIRALGDVSVLVSAALLDHHFDHHWPGFGMVRHSPLSFRISLELRGST